MTDLVHDVLDTWDGDHPCDLVHLGTGLRLTFCAYAFRANRFTRVPAGHPGLRLGRRDLRGGAIEFELDHEDTRIAVSVTRPTRDSLRLRWQALAHGEWGLRFWLCLALQMPGEDGRPARCTYDPDSGLLGVARPGAAAALLGERLPLMATFHDDLDALAAEYHQYGYWYLASRGTGGPLGVLRYNLEEMPGFEVALAWTDDPATAAGAARDALAAPPAPPPAPLQTGRGAGALDAVRDVMAWNTVYDAVNERPYTCLSRAWGPARFGGFGVWLDDIFFHALLCGGLDRRLARWNLDAVLAGATEAGNLPCLLTGRDAWVDRSQPPVGALVTWLLYRRHGDRELLERCFPVLLANHRWWWRHRDGNGNGLLEYGTSPVGDGLYRGTALAARDESMMDNSPMHDEARLDRSTWTLDCEDVGLNSLLVLDAEMLAEMAAVLGDDALAAGLRAQARAHAARISAGLFDEARGVFANRLWNGRFVRSITPTSFLPLLADAATPAQVEAMLGWLDDPERFGGEWLLPAVTRDDPAFRDNVYWRGRIWPPLVYLTWLALRRQGLDERASAVAGNGLELFMRAWTTRRQSPENFNGSTGRADDQPDTDLFYGWGALMPWLGVAEVCDVDPWHGWTVHHDGRDVRLGPLAVPGGSACLASTGGVLRVEMPGRPVFETAWQGRWRGLELEPRRCRVTLPVSGDATRWLRLAPLPDDAAPTLSIDGTAVPAPPVVGGALSLDAACLPAGAVLGVAW